MNVFLKLIGKDILAGIQDVDAASIIYAYPNPTLGVIILQKLPVNDTMQWLLFDVKG